MTQPPFHPSDPQPPLTGASFVEQRNVHPFAFAAVCLIAIFLLYQVGGALLTLIFIGGTSVTDENVGTVRVLTVVAQVMLIFVPTILFSRLLSRTPGSVLPVKRPSLREVVYGFIGLLALQRLLEVYMALQSSIPLPPVLERAFDQLREIFDTLLRTLIRADSAGELVVVIIVVAVIPSIVEELMFRGLIQSTLMRALTPFRAAMVGGVIFGLFHLNPIEAVPLIALGCYLGYLRSMTASVVLPIAAHFVNNLLAVVVAHLNMDSLGSIGTFGEASWPILTGQAAVASLLLVFAIRSLRKDQLLSPAGTPGTS